jgi:hypothetical protein
MSTFENLPFGSPPALDELLLLPPTFDMVAPLRGELELLLLSEALLASFDPLLQTLSWKKALCLLTDGEDGVEVSLPNIFPQYGLPDCLLVAVSLFESRGSTSSNVPEL